MISQHGLVYLELELLDRRAFLKLHVNFSRRSPGELVANELCLLRRSQLFLHRYLDRMSNHAITLKYVCHRSHMPASCRLSSFISRGHSELGVAVPNLSVESWKSGIIQVCPIPLECLGNLPQVLRHKWLLERPHIQR